jgi:hypothetical protein
VHARGALLQADGHGRQGSLPSTALLRKASNASIGQFDRLISQPGQ